MEPQEYKFRLEYIKGEDNVADGLSRINTLQPARKPFVEIHEDDKRRTMEQYHLALGHGSINNMKATIKHRYKWDIIFRDIENFVKSCPICKKAGTYVTNTKNKWIETNRKN
ncbi:hypothetical protein NGRA_3068 [Nosema granulosis]|uniref:Integrase zinc-binding domain-containing protein n=1 Tax=Nosema granulosis TaxID=83296 RepID=A0A9P6KY11_9MICR|nr:hypothetical protein NGRA_3068 [Nosema granulosis]